MKKIILLFHKADVIVPEILVTHLKNIGKYQITKRVLMKKILQEQQLQMTGLTDSDTALEIGKTMASRRMLLGLL